jgi:hypothetical protein
MIASKSATEQALFSFQAAPHIYQYIGAAGFSLAGGGKVIA